MRRTASRVRTNKREIENAGLGLAAGYFGAKYWGKTIATRAAEGKSITVPKLNMTYGKLVGGGAAIAGALGALGDDRTNTIALIGGAMVLGADAGVEGYLAAAAAAPAAGA